MALAVLISHRRSLRDWLTPPVQAVRAETIDGLKSAIRSNLQARGASLETANLLIAAVLYSGDQHWNSWVCCQGMRMKWIADSFEDSVGYHS